MGKKRWYMTGMPQWAVITLVTLAALLTVFHLVAGNMWLALLWGVIALLWSVLLYKNVKHDIIPPQD